jgi:hypothetical protein
MRKILLLISCLISIATLNAQTFIWAKRMGTTTTEKGGSVAVDASGNVYTTGYFQGTVDFDPGPGTANLTNAAGDDVYITKFNSLGNFVWVKQFTSNGLYCSGKAIAVDGSGNVYTTGFFTGTTDFDPGAGTSNMAPAGQQDIFISKLDASGNFVWAKKIGATLGDYGESIAIDGAGNVYTTGYFTSNVDFDPGAGVFNLNNASGADGFISKLDMNGNFVWAKQFGGSSGSTVVNSIALDVSGNILTTGYLQNVTDFDPGPASYTLTSTGGYDIFVSKLDAGGDFVWAKSMGGTIDDMGEGIDVDVSGNVYTAGHFYGTVDFDPGAAVASFSAPTGDNTFILKLDATGNYVWNKQLTASSGFVNNANDVAVDASGNVFTTGYFGGIGDFDPSPTSSYTLSSPSAYNSFISKLDGSGNFVWACTMYSSNGSEAHAIAVASGSVYTTGWFTLTADFDPSASVFSLTAAGSEEIFILKMSDALILNLTETIVGFNAIVYPNPTTSAISIETGETIETIFVRNLLGETVMEETKKSFSVEQLPAGIYILQIKTAKGMGTVRFVKE